MNRTKDVKLDIYHHIKVTTLVVLQMIDKKVHFLHQNLKGFWVPYIRILYFFTSTYLLKNHVVWTESYVSARFSIYPAPQTPAVVNDRTSFFLVRPNRTITVTKMTEPYRRTITNQTFIQFVQK